MSISVSTDKTQYLQGGTVGISGKVVDSQGNPILAAAVSVQVADPPKFIQVVYSDSSGAYSVSYILGASFGPGQYTVYATANRVGYVTAQQQTQFTVLAQATTRTSTSSSQGNQPSQCFIATATYGSEISPEVALLRSFRDTEVMQTWAGRGFMQMFNTFYYSFSPQLASFVASHETVRATMKVILYPLIGILYGSSIIFQMLSLNSELAVTLSGIFAATAIGFVYFGPLAILGRRLPYTAKHPAKPIWRIIPTLCGISTIVLIIAEVTSSAGIVSATAIAVVLSYAFLGMLVFAKSADTYLARTRNRKA